VATPDLGWIALGHFGRAMIVASATGRRSYRIETGPFAQDVRAALAPDGGRLALARGALLDLWDVATSTHLQRWQFTADVAALTYAQVAGDALLGVGLANGLLDVWG
jgi:hypothetical protein